MRPHHVPFITGGNLDVLKAVGGSRAWPLGCGAQPTKSQTAGSGESAYAPIHSRLHSGSQNRSHVRLETRCSCN